ncbi:MAG: phosphoesterase, partial [Candidatus Glassbacteria bacterium]|nr:phosphoesterase [Candidatus Glassbacteria bacterium]
VYVIHQPPAGVGQGMISEAADVGSRAVAEFLAERGGRLSLHGHIHESPFVGGRWRSKIGETTCVQPGQLTGDGCVSVVIDLESLEMDRSC